MRWLGSRPHRHVKGYYSDTHAQLYSTKTTTTTTTNILRHIPTCVYFGGAICTYTQYPVSHILLARPCFTLASAYICILYHTILYYTILYYIILYYNLLYRTIRYYTILYCTIIYYTTLYVSACMQI